ncbi:hypothetical protein GCM10027615_50420 [Plantactinospora veratri]
MLDSLLLVKAVMVYRVAWPGGGAAAPAGVAGTTAPATTNSAAVAADSHRERLPARVIVATSGGTGLPSPTAV